MLNKKYFCGCGEEIEPERVAIGAYICMTCGEERAKRRVRTIVPLHKGNYILVQDKEELKQLDPKHRS
jgi:hypothetical protein